MLYYIKMNQESAFILVGLGNPGTTYQGTRHNFGRDLLGWWRKAEPEIFSAWTNNKYWLAQVATGEWSDQPVSLVLPETFMNNSGDCLRAMKLAPEQIAQRLVLIHDDLDLTLGEIRPAYGRGSAGHHGVDSAIASLGTKDFLRLRLGIAEDASPLPAEEFVLAPFSSATQETVLPEIMARGISCLKDIIAKGTTNLA